MYLFVYSYTHIWLSVEKLAAARKLKQAISGQDFESLVDLQEQKFIE